MTKEEMIKELKVCFMNSVYGYDEESDEYDNIIRFNAALIEVKWTLDELMNLRKENKELLKNAQTIGIKFDLNEYKKD